MMEAFGPPVAQIQAVKRQLAEQKAQVAILQKQLDDIEAIVGRLARASEQSTANASQHLQGLHAAGTNPGQ